MPLYEYQCDSCQHRFEVIQKYSDARVDTCPKCGGTVKRLLSSPAIQFKGSGWYITDYAKRSGTDSGKESKSSEGESGSGKTDSAKTDSGKADSAKTDSAKTDAPSSSSSTPAKAD
jgi:putative FmdB family regulatory protein